MKKKKKENREEREVREREVGGDKESVMEERKIKKERNRKGGKGLIIFCIFSIDLFIYLPPLTVTLLSTEVLYN